MSATSAIVEAAAANGIQVTKPLNSYTPVFWAIVSAIILQLGYIVRTHIKGLPDRTRAETEGDIARRAADATAEAEFKKALMAEMGALRLRITDLERAVVDERRSCSEQIAGIERRHDIEVGILRGELDGMRKNFSQQILSQGNIVRLGLDAPTAISRLPIEDEE